MRTEDGPFVRDLPIRPQLVDAFGQTGSNTLNDGFVDTEPDELHSAICILLKDLLEGEQSSTLIHHLQFQSEQGHSQSTRDVPSPQTLAECPLRRTSEQP